MNRTDLQQLAELRITEAGLLLNNGLYLGAYYLAGYAVECGLKARIAKLTVPDEFPDKKRATQSYTHDLAVLVDVAQLAHHLKTERQGNISFDINWNTVKTWSETARYDLTISKALAEDFYAAITDIPNGVLPWLKKHW